MKIFVFGANGMLGEYVCKYLGIKYEIVRITRQDYDLSNITIDSLRDFLDNKQIKENDVVINCAGVIPQASKQRDLNTRTYFTVNSLFPIILSTICSHYNSQMIHITTDCVFSGKGGNYNEISIHDEINDYGLSKSLGEKCKATIIRTSIIGEERNNKRSLLEWVKSNKNKDINGYTNHYWNGVTCLQLAKIIQQIIEEKLFWCGVKHIFSNSVSKYELVSMINDIYDLNIKIHPLVTENKVDKTITSIYTLCESLNIPLLQKQIEDIKSFEEKSF